MRASYQGGDAGTFVSAEAEAGTLRDWPPDKAGADVRRLAKLRMVPGRLSFRMVYMGVNESESKQRHKGIWL